MYGNSKRKIGIYHSVNTLSTDFTFSSNIIISTLKNVPPVLLFFYHNLFQFTPLKKKIGIQLLIPIFTTVEIHRLDQ